MTGDSRLVTGTKREADDAAECVEVGAFDAFVAIGANHGESGAEAGRKRRQSARPHSITSVT